MMGREKGEEGGEWGECLFESALRSTMYDLERQGRLLFDCGLEGGNVLSSLSIVVRPGGGTPAGPPLC